MKYRQGSVVSSFPTPQIPAVSHDTDVSGQSELLSHENAITEVTDELDTVAEEVL